MVPILETLLSVLREERVPRAERANLDVRIVRHVPRPRCQCGAQPRSIRGEFTRVSLWSRRHWPRGELRGETGGVEAGRNAWNRRPCKSERYRPSGMRKRILLAVKPRARIGVEAHDRAAAALRERGHTIVEPSLDDSPQSLSAAIRAQL